MVNNDIDKPILIDNDRINLLFPFFISFNSDFLITNVGKSTKKLFPSIIGYRATDILSFIRPIKIEFSKKDWLEIKDQVVVFTIKFDKTITFRGQFVFFEENNEFCFFGSPWFTDADELIKHNLLVNDFALHNTITDLVQIIKANEIVTNDIKELVERLQIQKQSLNSVTQRLTSLIKNIQSAILVENENREIILVNEQFCNLFSIPVPPEKMIGLNCADSVEQIKVLFQQPNQFVKKINELLSNRKMVSNEILQMVDGRILERDFIPVHDKNEYLGHMWQYRDVTQAKLHEEEIRQNEEKYRRVLENLNLGMLEVDIDNKIIKAYPGFCKLIGYSEEELIGMNGLSLLAENNDIQKTNEENEKRLSGTPGVYEVQLKKKTGENIWVVISGAPTYNLKHEVIGSIGIHWEITNRIKKEKELELAKEEAEQSSIIKRQFLANMSHEIRTPINVILGMAELSLQSNDNAEIHELTSSIKLASNNLLNIINDVLDISKIESGKTELNEVEFELVPVFENLITQFKPLAKQKNIELEFFVQPELPKKLIGDDIKLKQIISNFLSNAVKFTHRGSIEIKLFGNTKKNKLLLKIKITDSGIGIAQEKINKIFDSFVQADSSTSRQFGGTGLGLSISKHFIELMNGQVFVQSKENFGTSFEIEIPFTIAKPISTKTSESQEKQKINENLEGVKILVAEDNELNQILIAKILNSWQCIFMIVENGEEALIELEKNNYDIVLLDIQMPKLDGYQTIEKIRKNHLLKNLSVIALTANALIEEKDKCLKLGMNEYISKPFNKTELYNKIKDLVKNNTPQLDLSYLNEVFNNDKSQINDVLNVLVEKTPALLIKLEEAKNNSTLVEIKKITHKLKATFAYFNEKNALILIDKIEQSTILSENETKDIDDIVKQANKLIEIVKLWLIRNK